VRFLDTDVCVELLRGNQAVAARRREIRDRVATTWITAAELYYGAARSASPEENRLLVGRFLAPLRILGLDGAVAERFGHLKGSLESQGQRLADFDLWIAATALCRGAVLVTGNRRHYERIPHLEIEDWIR
jgi:tRNA(fMet)-specific endonuclease VapC